MSSEDYGLVESILASVQWDRWQFMLSARKLCRQDVVVISHGHRDHLAANLLEKDIVLIPGWLRLPSELQRLGALVTVDYSSAVSKKLLLANIWTGRLRRILGHPIQRLHGSWWVASSGLTNVVFVGDLDLHETQLIAEFINHLLQAEQHVSGILLPSYGGIDGSHGALKVNELANAVENLAFDLKDVYKVKAAALPHPVEATWADYNAFRLPAVSDVGTRVSNL